MVEKTSLFRMARVEIKYITTDNGRSEINIASQCVSAELNIAFLINTQHMVTAFAKVRLFYLPKCSISGFETVFCSLEGSNYRCENNYSCRTDRINISLYCPVCV